MCRRYAPLVVLLLGWWAQSAHAQVRGLLRFTDGTVLVGTLVDRTEAGGVFRSERFGEVRFTTAEATFERDVGASASAVEAPPRVLALPAAEKAKQAWWPDSWSIGVSGYWQSNNGSKESDAAVDFDSAWTTDRDEVKLHLAADYRVVSDAVDNNEQSGRLRWVRALAASPWVTLASGRAHRSTVTIAPLPKLDYLLFQGTLGLGVRKKWSENHSTLVALGRDGVTLDLLDYGARVNTQATSLLVENNVQLAPKVSFDQTLYLYLWRDGDSGIDSQADIRYAVTRAVSVGLRHEYRRNAVNLDMGTFSKFSVTTRVGF